MLVKARIRIIGVDCPTCVYAIKRSVEKTKCASSISIDVNTGEAIVEYDDNACVLKDIYTAIIDAGYGVDKEKQYFDISRIKPEEAPILERKLLKLKGVFDVKISLTTNTMIVIYNPLETSAMYIEDFLRDKEVKPIAVYMEKGPGLLEKTVLFRRVASFLIGLSAVTVSMFSMFTGYVFEHSIFLNDYSLLLMALTVLVFNHDIILKGVKSLLMLTPTMDSLISFSSISTFIFGTLLLLNVLSLHEGLHTSTFYEASAGVVGFVGLGRYLEERIRRRSFKSLEKTLLSIKSKAHVLENNVVIEKSISEIKPGDVLEIKAGEMIPVDGVIIEGEGYVDESSFTGEPMPKLKKSSSRDTVLAGSILTSGYIRVKATRIGEDTIIAQIVETVREAESLKPRLARLADRIVGYFTWIVIAIAVFTFLYWVFIHSRLDLGVLFTASVLVIACPCALGIAIPLVVSIAVLKLSRKGIVTRTGDLFERILLTNTVIFDKTGTLTMGEPSIISIRKLKQIDDKELMELVCTVEKRSEHPVGKSMLKYCNSLGINTVEPEEFIHIPGEGVYGLVGGHSVGIGNLEFANRLGVKIDDEVVKAIYEIGLRGNTTVLVIIDHELSALLEIGDKLREEVSHVIKELKKKGYYIGLASGDSEASVKYYKDLLGLDFAYWGMKPSDKALLIKELQSKGFKIIFVGDGVNDAPALSVANVGVAMGRGSDLSKEAGDAILISNNLGDLVYLMKFSRIVKRKMIQNLLWAFIYNASLIPIAMGSLYPKLIIYPELAAVAMVLSDISVVLNAMVLMRYK